MNQSFLAKSICMALAYFFSPGAAAAQDAKKPAPAQGKPLEPASHEEFAQLAEPNEHHARLQKLVGTWSVEVTVPSSDGATKSSGTAEYKSILGGRFVTEQVRCDLGGAPFEWFGIYGHDNLTGKYTAVWVDNLGTGTDSAEGTSAGEVITLVGETPETKAKILRFKWIIRLKGADAVRIEMVELGPKGEESPQLTLTLKRNK